MRPPGRSGFGHQNGLTDPATSRPSRPARKSCLGVLTKGRSSARSLNLSFWLDPAKTGCYRLSATRWSVLACRLAEHLSLAPEKGTGSQVTEAPTWLRWLGDRDGLPLLHAQ